MRYIAAYMLLVLGGHANPTEADISKVLKSVGAEAEASQISKLVKELHGKSVDELMAAGSKKLASVSVGAAPAAAAPAAGAAASAPAKGAEKKKEEPKEEEEEVGTFFSLCGCSLFNSMQDMGFGLFD